MSVRSVNVGSLVVMWSGIGLRAQSGRVRVMLNRSQASMVLMVMVPILGLRLKVPFLIPKLWKQWRPLSPGNPPVSALKCSCSDRSPDGSGTGTARGGDAPTE